MQAFHLHSVALPYGSSVNLPPYWELGELSEPRLEGGRAAEPPSKPPTPMLTPSTVAPTPATPDDAAADASGLKPTAADEVEAESLRCGEQQWDDTNYDVLLAGLGPRALASQADYVPPGRPAGRYGPLHAEGSKCL